MVHTVKGVSRVGSGTKAQARDLTLYYGLSPTL